MSGEVIAGIASAPAELGQQSMCSAVASAKTELLPYQKAAGQFWLPKFEQMMLSVLLNHPTETTKLVKGLTAEHFINSVHLAVFRSILRLVSESVRINSATVTKNLLDTQPDDVADWVQVVKAIAAVPFEEKQIAVCKTQLKLAAAVRGGDAYAYRDYNEPFCAELFLARQPMTRCVGEAWYVYHNGVWLKHSRDLFRKTAADCIHPEHRKGRRILDLVTNVESRLQVPETFFVGAYKFVDDSVHINVQNGVVQVERDGRISFREHSPDDNFTSMISATFDLNATCPLFDAFMSEALPDPADRRLMQNFMGYVLYPGCNYEVCLVCFGPSATGKSTFAAAMRSTLGDGPCAAVGLEELCKPGSYSLPTLKYKMLNLGSELNGTEVEESSQFKMVVSGDFLNAREIYGRPGPLRTTAKLMFLSNHMPQFRKGTDAELRRLRMIEFRCKPVVKDLQLKTKLRAETSGILNWMIKGLTTLLHEGEMPRGGEGSEHLLTVFSKSNDPIGKFIEQCCELTVTGEVIKDVLVDGFKEWCEVNGIVLASDKIESFFFRTLRNRFPQLGYARRRNTGKGCSERLRFVLGLRLLEKGSPLMPKEVGEEFEDALLGHNPLKVAVQIEAANSRSETGAVTSDEQGVEDRRSRRTHLTSVVDSPPPIIVTRRESLEHIAQAVRKADTVGFDLETYGETLDPWRGDIRILSLALPNSPPWLLDLKSLGYDLGPLGPALESVELIGHIAKFDALWLRVKCRLRLSRLYCTCTASRLLTAGTDEKNDLGRCLSSHLGVDLAKDQGCSDWGGMVLTSEQIAYCADDVRYLHTLRAAMEDQLREAGLEEIAKIEMALLPLVVDMESTGFAVNRDSLVVLRDRAREQVEANRPTLGAKLGPSVNPDSPRQLVAALKDLGIVLEDTSEESLLQCADTHVIPALLDYRKAKKRLEMTQTLIDSIKSDDKIHGQFNPTGTATGRFSSKGPNMQNVERGEVRQCFVASANKILVVADYSQIELRIAAAVAREPLMIEAYRAGVDLHVRTASIILNKSEDDITADERHLAKGVNFGLLYGQKADGLVRYLKTSYRTSITKSDAEKFIRRFFRSYTGLQRWQQKARRIANDSSVKEIRTRLLRRRLIPRGQYWQRYTSALNTPIQGGSTDGLKLALLRLARDLPPGANLVSTVHDEIIVECRSEDSDSVRASVAEAMRATMAELYPEVPIVVEAKVSSSWGEK